MAETLPEVVLDDEARRLQLEQAKAEFRRKTAEANAARLSAVLPTGSASPAAGGVTISEGGGTSLASVVAAAKLHDAADEIAKAIKAAVHGKPIVIVEDRAVAQSDAVLTDVETAIASLGELLADIEASLPSVIAPPAKALEGLEEGEGEGEGQAAAEVGGGPTTAGAGPLGLVGDLIGMFRSDFSVQPAAVHVDRLALVAEVARRLGPDTVVVLPTMSLVAQSEILVDARALLVRRMSVARRVDRLKSEAVDPTAAVIARAEAHLAALVASHDKLVADGDAKAPNLEPSIAAEKAVIAAAVSDAAYQAARAVVDSARSALTVFDGSYAAIMTAPAGAAAPVLQAAIRQQIRVATADSEPLLLWLDVTSSGGDMVTKKSPLGWNSEVSFLGAVQAVYLLVSSSGTIAASGAESQFGHRSYDFDRFFGTSARAWNGRLQGWFYEVGELTMVALLALLALYLIGRVVS